MKIKKSYICMGFLFLIISLTAAGLTNQNLKPQYELEYPKESAGEIIIITPENKTYTETMSGYYPATYGFENDEIGSDPEEWDVFEGAGYVNVKDEMYDHKNIIEMYDNTNTNHDELHDSFQSQTNGTLEFWVMSDNTYLTFSIILIDDTETSVWGDSIGWIQIYQDNIRYQDATDWHATSKMLSDNTWYHLKVEFECTTGNYHGLAQDTYRFYVDGELFGDYAFRDDISNVSQIYCATYGSATGYRCYVDAFGYSWDQSYGIGDNLNEGLLLSFESSTTLDWQGYSLDGMANKTILGNATIPLPSDGSHNIQVFGNDSIDTMYHSDMRYFTVNTDIYIVTPENKTYTEAMSGYYPATFGFENDEIGSDPEEWDVFEGAGYVNVKDEMYDHKNIIEMYDNTNTNHDELHDSFQSQTNGTLEFWVMSDNTYLTFSIILIDDTETSVWGDSIGWIQIYQDNIRYQDATDWHATSKMLSDNTWYHLKVEFECTTGNYHGLAQDTYRFYVDGELFGDYAFRDDISNVSQIYCATYGSATGYRCYVDAFGYSWDPDYLMGDNQDEGLLLSFESSSSLDWQGYSLDGMANKTILGNATIPLPSDGSHNIQVFGNDSIDTMYHSDVRYFTTNAFGPDITINIPVSNQLYGNISPDFSLSIPDSDLNATWYSLDGGITTIPFTGLTGTIDQVEWDKIGNGTATITFYANDTVNNIGQADVTVRKDIITPIITINDPISSTVYGTTPPDFSLSISGSDLDATWYSLDGGTTTIPFTGLTGTIDQTEWDKFGNGTATITFYANDTVNNLGQAEVMVRKDILAPAITINVPISSTVYGTTPPDFNLSIPDPDLNATWYSLDGGTTNIPFSGLTGTLDQIEWEKIGNGTATITFYANDTVNNLGQAEVVVRKDIIIPGISITLPVTAEEFEYPPIFDISIDELNLDKTWYSLNGGNNITFIGLTGTINQALWDALPDGNVIIRFYANDTAGNIGTNSVTVVKIPSTTPPEIPGYDLYILIGIFGVISMLLIRKRLKH